MIQSLQRLSHHLRGLLRSLAGEDPDPTDPLFDADVDPDYEPEDSVDLGELENLLETLDERSQGGYPGADGRAEWAVERESEIARLEKENEEMRKLLGIDEENLAATGVKLDLERVESGRYSSFLRKGPSSGDAWSSYWDNQQSQTGGGAPLQRAMDLQPGMRPGQGRRTGIFGGGGRGRGGLTGIGIGQIPGGTRNNQPPSPSPIPGTPWARVIAECDSADTQGPSVDSGELEAHIWRNRKAFPYEE